MDEPKSRREEPPVLDGEDAGGHTLPASESAPNESERKRPADIPILPPD